MNKNLLKSCIVREGYTAEVVAQKIGITSHSFSAKVNGKNDFKLSEIQDLIKILCLDKDEVIAIFFGE